MEKRYQVFISSTFEDLQEERKAVINAILQHNCFPSGMELFPASDLSQFDYIKSVIDESDYYILISAGKYGTISDQGISFTEMEYDYALEKGIPILTFLISKIDELKGNLIEKDDVSRGKLSKFREKVSANKLCNYYTSCDNLQNHVSKSLSQAIKMTPRTGWIRGDKENNFSLLEQLNSLRIENEELRTELATQIKSGYQEESVYDDLIGLDDEFDLEYNIDYKSDNAYGGDLREIERTTLSELFKSFGDQLLDGFTNDNLSVSLAYFLRTAAYDKVSRIGDAITYDGIEYDFQVILPEKTITRLLISLAIAGIIEKNSNYYSLSDAGRKIVYDNLVIRKTPF